MKERKRTKNSKKGSEKRNGRTKVVWIYKNPVLCLWIETKKEISKKF